MESENDRKGLYYLRTGRQLADEVRSMTTTAPMADLAGKTAFVTGGANGIGLGIARALVRAGANVVVADIRESALDEARSSLGADAQVETVQLDVTDRAPSPAPPIWPRRGSARSIC